jgi:hypothetical protein
MSAKKETAVEWLVKELNDRTQLIPMRYWDDIRSVVEQAKQLEKEQIIEAHSNGKSILPPNENGEQYYSQTFGTNSDGD